VAGPENREGLLRVQEGKIRVEFKVRNGVFIGPISNQVQFQDVVSKKGVIARKDQNGYWMRGRCNLKKL
jgi:hypothetical protein